LRLAASSVCLAIFWASFALVTLGLRPALGGGDVPASRREIKFREFARHKDEYDTLVFGSSRTFRGFDPENFDRLTEAAGTPTRTFNFGIPGARVMEIDRLLERIERLEPARLRWVFVDPERFQVLVDDENALSRAVIDWHDVARTRLICSYAVDGEEQLSRAWRRVRPHLVAAAYNLLGVGRGLELSDQLLGFEPDPETILETLGSRGDGFPVRDNAGPRHRRFLRQIEVYHELVEAYRAQEPAPGPPSPQAVQAFAGIARRVRALGAEPVFLTQPGLYRQDDLIQAAEAGEVGTLWRYDDPDRVPGLYAPEARFDANHLNQHGAELFTELVARDFARMTADRERGQ